MTDQNTSFHLNILVVDDSPLAARKMQAMFEEIGHRVVAIANTGTEAIRLYRQYNPDLVCMDITMPDMDGITATQKIVAEFSDAKIVIVTSHGQEDMVRKALKAGARGYVLKPVKPEKLFEHIGNALEG